MYDKKETVISLSEEIPNIDWKLLRSKRSNYFSDLISTYGTNILLKADKTGLYPIHWAVILDKIKIVEEMIRSGVLPSMKALIYDEPQPIHFAASEGNVKIIDLLLSNGVDINAKDKSGCTPFIRAAMFGNNFRIKSSETVLHLVSCGADINATDIYGQNAMHYAILNGSEETVHLLLNLGLDPNKTTNKGLRALDFANQCGNAYLIKALAPLTHGVNQYDAKEMVNKYSKRRLRETLTEMLTLLARIVVIIAVFSAIFWTYPQYILYYLPQSTDYIGFHISLILLNVILWVSWYKTCTVDPGYLPRNTTKYKQIIKFKVNSGLKNEKIKEKEVLEKSALSDPYSDRRLCHTCKTVQTDRSTHCVWCQRCVALFDHHCIYLSTCIGANNRLSFFVLCVSMCLNGLIGSSLVMIVAEKDGSSLFTSYHWFNFCYCLKFALIGTILTLCNLRRAAINLTQNEEFKCRRYRYLCDSEGRFTNPFDKGSYWTNIVDYFSPKSFKYTKVKTFDY